MLKKEIGENNFKYFIIVFVKRKNSDFIVLSFKRLNVAGDMIFLADNTFVSAYSF